MTLEILCIYIYLFYQKVTPTQVNYPVKRVKFSRKPILKKNVQATALYILNIIIASRGDHNESFFTYRRPSGMYLRPYHTTMTEIFAKILYSSKQSSIFSKISIINT